MSKILSCLLTLMCGLQLIGQTTLTDCAFHNVNLIPGTPWEFYDPGGPGGSSCTQDAPGNYPNSNCITRIRFNAPAGHTVKLTLDTLSMYNTVQGWDWLVIYDGATLSSPILFDNRGLSSSNAVGTPYGLTTPATDNDGLPNENTLGPDTTCSDFVQYNGGIITLCSTGRKMRIEFKATSVVNRSGFHGFGEALLAGTCTDPLPVELTEFDGDCNNLYWSTASENSNDHFRIESSTDGYTWEIVDHVIGQGWTTNLTNYSLPIYPRSEVTYYRLIQVDYDGAEEAHNTISVFCESREKEILKYIDLMGREIHDVNVTASSIYIIVYTDGTTKKICNGSF